MYYLIKLIIEREMEREVKGGGGQDGRYCVSLPWRAETAQKCKITLHMYASLMKREIYILNAYSNLQ